MKCSLPLRAVSHVAIIPDGNRRWARALGKDEIEGHVEAINKTLPALLDKAREMGVKNLTVWALSTENLLKRSKRELKNIFSLIKNMIKNKLVDFKKHGIRFSVIGNLSTLPKDLQDVLDQAINETVSNTEFRFTIAINYGGRDEIKRAIKKLLKFEKNINSEKDINLEKYLDTRDMPDPDIIIRTGGDRRVSGFMLWQSEYSEYFFVDSYFPDFTPDKFESCLNEFTKRERRFGA